MTMTPDGRYSATAGGVQVKGDKLRLKPPGQWNRLRVTTKGEMAFNGGEPLPLKIFDGLKKGALVLRPEGEMEFANLFVREVK